MRFHRTSVQRFSAAVIVVAAAAALLAQQDDRKGQVNSVTKLSIEITKPVDRQVVKIGDPVGIAVSTSGFMGVNLTIREDATGKPESLRMALQSGKADSIEAKTWAATWRSAGHPPGVYKVTATPTVNGREDDRRKTVVIELKR